MSFDAKWPGACAYGDRIDVGDKCQYTDDEEIAHVECVHLDGPANVNTATTQRNERQCSDCFTIHAGECL